MNWRHWAGVLAVGLAGCAGAAEPGETDSDELRAGKHAPLDRAVNYAFAGAPTGGPTFADVFQPAVAAGIRAYGLQPGTLDNQLFQIEQTRHDIDGEKDLVFLW